MLQWLRKQFIKMAGPSLDWVQIEVTSRCNAACIYCPHTLMGDRWPDKHMPLDLFRKLLPYLGNTGLIFLQGWGEPLLNKDLFEMIRLCKDQGNRVGFTTNGMLLTESAMKRIVELGLDVLGLSLAGTTAATHNRIRKGADFDTALSRFERLRAIKEQKRTGFPSIHLAYLMLQDNLYELEGVVPLAERLGVDQIVASQLSLVLTPELSRDALFNSPENSEVYTALLERIKALAAEKGISFFYNGPDLNEASSRCDENVHRSCLISVDGDVVPCVFTDPVLCGEIESEDSSNAPYLFKDRPYALQHVVFGNIGTETLTDIWNKPEYIAFRRRHDPKEEDRFVGPSAEFPICCARCYKRLLEIHAHKAIS